MCLPPALWSLPQARKPLLQSDSISYPHAVQLPFQDDLHHDLLYHRRRRHHQAETKNNTLLFFRAFHPRISKHYTNIKLRSIIIPILQLGNWRL